MLLTTHAEAQQVHITVHLHENVAREQKLETNASCRPVGLGSRGVSCNVACSTMSGTTLCICMAMLQGKKGVRWMPVADLKDWAAEGDVEEGFHRGSKRGAPRHHKPDPPTKGCLHCLQHCAVYKGAQLHTIQGTF